MGSAVSRSVSAPRGLDQPPAERGVADVGARLGETGDRVALRHPAAAEPGQLRKDEPHPVRALLPGAQFLQGLVVGVGLGVEELEVVDRSLPQAPSPVQGALARPGWRLRIREDDADETAAVIASAVLGVLGSAAWRGGLALVTDPSGARLRLTVDLLPAWLLGDYVPGGSR